MEPAEDFDIDIRLSINSSVAASTTITNCATVDIAAEDSWPYNNTDCVVDTVRSPGTNLRVYKRVEWQGQDQIRYDIYFENIGTVDLSDVLITDTYPISTSLNGWWADYHRSVNEEAQDPAQIVFRVDEIQRSDAGRISLVLDLDGGIAGTQGLIFTNTVEAPISGDIYPADNLYEKAAFTGPDIYVEKTLSGGELRARKLVTFTVEFGNRNQWPWNADDNYGTSITDTLPAGMTFITATAPWDPNQSWTPNELPGNVFEWDAGPMWNDSTWYFDVVVQITDTASAGDVLTNSVEIQGQSPTDVEPYYDNNTSELPVTIADKFSTVTTLDSSLNPSEPGESVTFVVTVTSTGDTPIGSVMFYDDGALLGTRTLNGSGTASYATSALAAGTHPITATYGGDASFEVSTSSVVNQVVNTPPVASSDGYTTTTNTTLTVTAPGVMTNDTDADSHPLTATLDTDVLTGTLDLHADGSFVYTPTQDYTGVVTFTYHVNDGYADSNTVQVTITVRDFTVYLPLVLRNY
jgi:uncharacterized repeat protein (TIGR01451 family)